MDHQQMPKHPEDAPSRPGRSEPSVARLMGPILVSTFIRLILNVARRFVYPFAPALSRELHVPLTAVTAMIAVNQTTGLVGLLAGPMADRWGTRNMMLAGVVMLTVGMALCGLVPVYLVVFIGLMLAGAAKITFDPAIQAFVGRHVPFARRGVFIGLIETAWAGSTLIGIPLIALVVEGFGLRWAFFCMAILGGLGGLLLFYVLPKDPADARAAGRHAGLLAMLVQLIKHRPTAGMLGFGFWISMANDNLFVVYGAWLENSFAMGIVALGASTSVIGAAELLGESLTVAIGDRVGLKRSVVAGLCLATAGYLLLPLLGKSLPLAMGGLFVIFLAFEFTIVSSFGLSTELLPASRATMMAGFYAAAGFGRMAGAFTGGALWVSFGVQAVTLLSAAATVLGLICLVWGLSGWRAQDDDNG